MGGCEVIGFVGGTHGLYSKCFKPLTPALVDEYRHTGGYELLGRTSDTLDDYGTTAEIIEELELTGLVVVGGTISNTHAAYLAEEVARRQDEDGHCGRKCAIVGAPVAMGGSFVNTFVEQSLGFDSVVKSTGRLVGNTAIDGSSARKYYYFLRTMEGSNSNSHVTLEVALQTKPNFIVLGERVKEKRQTLEEVVVELADLVVKRHENGGKNFGTILIPDGLLENIAEFKALLNELGRTELQDAGTLGGDDLVTSVIAKLTPWSAALFRSLPSFVIEALVNSCRKTQGNIYLAHVETERLLAEMTAQELSKRKKSGSYKGSFSPVCQFLGYQSRSTVPSEFDSCYGYALGGAAATLVLQGLNGYLATISKLSSFGASTSNEEAAAGWKVSGVPLTAMFSAEGGRFGYLPPAGVDLSGPGAQRWSEIAESCALKEMYENPGPTQFRGRCAVATTERLQQTREEQSYVEQLHTFRESLDRLAAHCRPGCAAKRLKVANSSLSTLKQIMDQI